MSLDTEQDVQRYADGWIRIMWSQWQSTNRNGPGGWMDHQRDNALMRFATSETIREVRTADAIQTVQSLHASHVRTFFSWQGSNRMDMDFIANQDFGGMVLIKTRFAFLSDNRLNFTCHRVEGSLLGGREIMLHPRVILVSLLHTTVSSHGQVYSVTPLSY